MCNCSGFDPVTPLTYLTKCRSISVFQCFPKVLKKLMYSELYMCLTENNIVFRNQFGFQAGHSTNHEIIVPVDEIANGFIED